mgnify:FL=1
MDNLAFTLRHRLSAQPAGARKNSMMDGYRHPAAYIDFVVNGRSFADLFGVDQSDLVGMLTPQNLHTPPPEGRQIFNHFERSGQLINELMLVLPCRLEYRRVHIFGCPECGDLYCGSVTMQIIETPQTVIWQRFDNGREENAPYMSVDKSYTSGNLYDLWLQNNRDYAVLDAFGLSALEADYEFLGALKYGEIVPERDADIRRGAGVVIDFPEVGPFEFDKNDYLRAFAELRQGMTSAPEGKFN